MTSKDYQKMADMLEDLAIQYTKAASESLKWSPGEFHRLLTLSEKADDLAEDLRNAQERKLEEELRKSLEVKNGTL